MRQSFPMWWYRLLSGQAFIYLSILGNLNRQSKHWKYWWVAF